MKIASTAGHFHLCNNLLSDLLQHKEMKLYVNSGIHYDNTKKDSIKPESFDISLNLSIFISYLIRAFDQQEQLSKGVQIMGSILQKFNSNLSLTTSLVEMAHNRQSNNLYINSSVTSHYSMSDMSSGLQQPNSSPKFRIAQSQGGPNPSFNRGKAQKFLESFDTDVSNILSSFPCPALLSSDVSHTLNHATSLSSAQNLKTANKKHPAAPPLPLTSLNVGLSMNSGL